MLIIKSKNSPQIMIGILLYFYIQTNKYDFVKKKTYTFNITILSGFRVFYSYLIAFYIVDIDKQFYNTFVNKIITFVKNV